MAPVSCSIDNRHAFDIVFESRTDVEHWIISEGEPLAILKAETHYRSRCSALRRSRRCAPKPVEEKAVAAAHHVSLPGSERQSVFEAFAVGIPDAEERLHVTVYVRKNPQGVLGSSARTEGGLRPLERLRRRQAA